MIKTREEVYEKLKVLLAEIEGEPGVNEIPVEQIPVGLLPSAAVICCLLGAIEAGVDPELTMFLQPFVEIIKGCEAARKLGVAQRNAHNN